MTTASRPPGASTCSAAASPPSSSCKLLVEVDPDRLEGAGRRVLLHARHVAERLADDLGELAGPLDRPGGDDGAGDPARLGLLAIMVDDVGDLRLVGGMLRKSAALSPSRRHAHVERAVGLEGEAALGPVELHRGDADIERHAVDRLDAAVGKRLTHPGKTLRNKRQAPPARSRQGLAFCDRIGIAIEGEDSGRPLFENGPGVAAGAEGAVDMGFAGGDGERGDHLVEQHRDVRGGSGLGAHGAMPFSSRRQAAISRKSAVAALRARAAGFQISTMPPTADEQGQILDPALAAHHRGQDDPAAGVVGNVLGHAERAAGAGDNDRRECRRDLPRRAGGAHSRCRDCVA